MINIACYVEQSISEIINLYFLKASMDEEVLLFYSLAGTRLNLRLHAAYPGCFNCLVSACHDVIVFQLSTHSKKSIVRKKMEWTEYSIGTLQLLMLFESPISP